MTNIMVDFHSHVLPKIDDGSSSVRESVEMLKLSVSHGVDIIIATPHFYPTQDKLDSFLDNRNRAMYRVKNYCTASNKEIGINLAFGAEVAYFDNISDFPNLDKLCILGTKTMLLELPYKKINEGIYNEISNVRNRGLKIVIAHCDRYLKFGNKTEIFEKLIDRGAYIQANNSFFCNTFSKRKALKLFENNQIHVFGSDAHNMRGRKPNFDMLSKTFSEEIGQKQLELLHENQVHLLKGAKVMGL